MPDSPEKRLGLPRSHVADVIERRQEDAARQLRQAGVPEAHALLIMQRISLFCLQTLRQLDLLYREFEEMVAEDGRSDEHQHWLNEKATALLLQLESGIAEIVATGIRQAIRDLLTQPSPPGEVITPVRAKPSRPDWSPFLLRTLQVLVWLVGMAASVVFAWQFTGSYVLAGIALLLAGGLWVMFRSTWWGLLFLISALGWALVYFF